MAALEVISPPEGFVAEQPVPPLPDGFVLEGEEPVVPTPTPVEAHQRALDTFELAKDADLPLNTAGEVNRRFAERITDAGPMPEAWVTEVNRLYQQNVLLRGRSAVRLAGMTGPDKTQDSLVKRFGKQLFNATIGNLAATVGEKAVQFSDWKNELRRRLPEVLTAMREFGGAGPLGPAYGPTLAKKIMPETYAAKEEAAAQVLEPLIGKPPHPLVTRGEIAADFFKQTGTLTSPQETTPEQVVDIAAGLIGFVAQIALLEGAGVPPMAAWETVSLSNGGAPGDGATMYAVLGGINALFPGGGGVGILKRATATGAVFGGMAAAEGGDRTDVLINAGIPFLFEGIGITKRAWKEAKAPPKDFIAAGLQELGVPGKKSDIIQTIGDLLPEITAKERRAGETPVRGMKVEGIAQEAAKPAPAAPEAPGSPRTGAEAPTGPKAPAGEGTPPEVMAPKLASTAEGRELAGLPKRKPPAPKTDVELVAAAKAELAEKPDAGRVLVEDPARIRTDQDEVVLGLHLTRLRNEWNAAADRLAETKKAGDMAAHAEAKADLDRLTPELDRAFGVAEGLMASTNPARMLRARKLGFTRDYSLAQAKQNWSASHDGETPPPKVVAELAAKVETLKGVEKELASRAEKGEAAAENQAAKQAHEELTKKVPKDAVPDQAGGAERTAALERFAGRELPPGRERNAALGALANKIAKKFVAEGVRDREQLFSAVHKELKKVDPEITRHDSDMALSGYGDFRPLNAAEGAKFLRQAKQETQLLLKIEDVLNKNPLLRSGPEREPMTDEGRRLTQLLNEYKRKYGVTVTDPAKQLKSVLDGIKTRLRNRISDLRDQIAKGEKTVKTKTKVAHDAEAAVLKAEYDAVKREFDEIFGKPELTDEQRVARAIAAIERSEAGIAARIESGTYADLFPGKKESKTPNTEALRAARAQRDAKRAELEELRAVAAPDRTPEERAVKASMTRLTNRIAELQATLASGEYERPLRPTPRLKTRAELALEAKKQKLQWELDAKRESTTEKVLRAAVDVTGIQRTMLTGGDISNTFRQNLFVLWNDLGNLATGRPADALKWARSTKAEVKAFASGPRAEQAMEILAADPDYQLLRRYGMEHVEYAAGTTEGKRPEGFPSKLASKWPGMKQSLRAAAVATNVGRREIGVELLTQARESGRELTPDLLRDIARVANDSTGRTTLPKGRLVSEFADIANRLMFSPRLLGSRIENIRTLFHAIDGDPLIRAHGIRTLVGGVATMATVGGIAKLFGVDIEVNPLSADFMKVKIGNTRYDFLGGVGQVLRFMAQMAYGLATGKTQTASGRMTDFEWDETVWRFVKSKEAAIFNLATMVYTGETYQGKKIEGAGEWTKELGMQFMFLWVQDGIDAFADEMQKPDSVMSAAAKGLGAAAISNVGIGVQTYPERASTALAKYEDKVAQEAHGKSWIDLSPQQVEDLRQAHEAEFATLKEKAAVERLDAAGFEYRTASAERQREAGIAVEKNLSDKVQGVLKEAAVMLSLERKHGDWTMNDARFERYQQLVAERLNAELPDLAKGVDWRAMEFAEKQRVVGKALARARKYALDTVRDEANEGKK